MTSLAQVQRHVEGWCNSIYQNIPRNFEEAFSEDLEVTLEGSVDGKPEPNQEYHGRDQFMDHSTQTAGVIRYIIENSFLFNPYFRSITDKSELSLSYKQIFIVENLEDGKSVWSQMTSEGRQKYTYPNQSDKVLFTKFFNAKTDVLKELTEEESLKYRNYGAAQKAYLRCYSAFIEGNPSKAEEEFTKELEVEMNACMDGRILIQEYTGRQLFIEHSQKVIDQVRFVVSRKFEFAERPADSKIAVRYEHELIIENVKKEKSVWTRMHSIGTQEMTYTINDNNKIEFTKYVNTEKSEQFVLVPGEDEHYRENCKRTNLTR